MPFIPFPVIPILEDDPVMAVSAATIDKGHNSGLYYILGESHASMPAGPWHHEHRDEDSWYNVCSVFLYHTSLTVWYGLNIKVDEVGENWNYEISAYTDEDEHWHVMKTASAANDTTYDWESGVIDIADTPEGDLTALFPLNKIYEWRFRIERDESEHYWVHIDVWGLFCREAIADWNTPHTFMADEASAEEHFNDIREDLNWLRDQLSPIVPFSFCRNTATGWKDDDAEYAFIIGVYRYRPESLYGMIKVEFEYTGENFRLYMRVIDTAGNDAKVYESGNIASTGHDQVVEATVDLTTGDAATALTAAGITLTLGNYYRILVGIQEQEGDVNYRMEFGVIARVSSGTPHASWVAPEEWAESDTDFGPTRLNRMKTDLELFYTGGGEVMWGESPSVLKWYPTISTRVLSTIHRKRWLLYHVYSDGTGPIKLWYGDDYDVSYELPDGEGWLNFDLTQLPIPWGSWYHLVGNTDGAFECDDPYE